MLNILDYYNELRTQDIHLAYIGPLESEGIGNIGSVLRRQLVEEEVPLSTSQAVFSVFVEQMTNMLFYSSAVNGAERTPPSGILVMGLGEDGYYIQTGNFMLSKNVGILKEKIDYLNSLDKTGLRSLYKQRLRGENPNPESRGAGLGLIEIARRARSKIEYDFVPSDEGHAFFTMHVTVT